MASLPRRGAATLAVLVLIAAAVSGVPLSETVSCHICGPPSRDSSNLSNLFPGQPPPPACQADPGPDDRVCPVNHKGCLTTYDGKVLTRTCADFANGPCQVANGVVYCYCSGRLCNSQTEQQMQRLLRADGQHDDDEDGGGAGSGDGDDARPWDGSDTPRLDDLVPAVFDSSITTTRSHATSTAGKPRNPSTSTSSNDEFYMSGETTPDETGVATATTESTRKANGGKGSAQGLRANTVIMALITTCIVLPRL